MKSVCNDRSLLGLYHSTQLMQIHKRELSKICSKPVLNESKKNMEILTWARKNKNLSSKFAKIEKLKVINN